MSSLTLAEGPCSINSDMQQLKQNRIRRLRANAMVPLPTFECDEKLGVCEMRNKTVETAAIVYSGLPLFMSPEERRLAAVIPMAINVYRTSRDLYAMNGQGGWGFADFVLNWVGRTRNLVLTPDEDFGRLMYQNMGWKWSAEDVECNFLIHKQTNIPN